MGGDKFGLYDNDQILLQLSYREICDGYDEDYGKPGKSWNFVILFSRPRKSWIFILGHGKSLYIMFMEKYC